MRSAESLTFDLQVILTKQIKSAIVNTERQHTTAGKFV